MADGAASVDAETATSLPDADSVAAAIAALYATAEFARAPVMRRLLDYLVAETMAGRGAAVKGYAVAVEGLGRDADFDPQTDSYPRVQVGRLRRMLDSHYGRAKPGQLTIAIPSGGYRVAFGQAAAAPLPDVVSETRPRRRWAVIGAIGAFVVLSAVAIAALLVALRPSVFSGTAEITRAPTLAVVLAEHPGQATEADRRLDDVDRRVAQAVSRSPIATLTGREAARSADYVLTLSTDAAGKGLTLDLIYRQTGQQLWSDSLAMPVDEASVATMLLPRVGIVVRPAGVIAAHQRGLLETDFSPGYPCLLHFQDYFHDRTPDLLPRVADCVERTVTADPVNAEALAAASFLQFDWSLTRTTEEARRKGAEFARRAVQANPYSARALIADARVALVGGNCVRGAGLIDRATALDPFDPGVLALAGLLFIPCDAVRAEQLLRRARALEPDLAAFYTTLLVVLEVERGNAAGAEQIARSMRPPGAGQIAQYQLGRLFADAANGRIDEARDRWRRVVDAAAPPRDTPDEVLRQFYYSAELRTKLLSRMRDWRIFAPPALATTPAARETGPASMERRK